MLRPIIAKSMLHYHDTEFSTNWDANIYRGFERESAVMPGVLKAFIQAKNPLAFATKSTLPLRDLDLFAQLAKVTRVDIAVSVSVMN